MGDIPRLRFTAEQAARHNTLRKVVREDRRENGVGSTEDMFMLLLEQGIGDASWVQFALTSHNYYCGYLNALINQGYYKQIMCAWVAVKMGKKPTKCIEDFLQP